MLFFPLLGGGAAPSLVLLSGAASAPPPFGWCCRSPLLLWVVLPFPLACFVLSSCMHLFCIFRCLLVCFHKYKSCYVFSGYACIVLDVCFSKLEEGRLPTQNKGGKYHRHPY